MVKKAKEVQYGTTPPISTDEPTEYHLHCTKVMETFLEPFNLREGKESASHREVVLGQLDQLLQQWIRDEYALLGLLDPNNDEDGHDEDDEKTFRVQLCTFGSYRLGVNASHSDIDSLCVGPRLVPRERFFDSLVARLKSLPKAQEVTPVPDAYVPVVKMIFDGIDIDLVYAPINMDHIPHNLSLLDDSLLFSLDEKTVTSLNGCRVTDMVLKLIPNVESFRGTLVFMKFWAQRRGVYSNVLGFLGGISWALLTARICQLYPNATPAFLIHKFFHFYGRVWKWPAPVMLTEVRTHPYPDGSGEYKVWDPKKNKQDGRDLMPILTPAFPSMNSTYNVSKTTLRIIKKELLRGYAITSLMLEKKIEDLNKVWEELCQPSSFFMDYKHYLAIVLESTDEDVQVAWKGFVQSKIRKFLGMLERSTMNDVHYHPRPEPVHETVQDMDLATQLLKEKREREKEAAAEAAEDAGEEQAETEADEKQDGSEDEIVTDGTIYRDTFFIGLQIINKATILNLSQPISQFKGMLEDGNDGGKAVNIESLTGKTLRKILGLDKEKKKTKKTSKAKTSKSEPNSASTDPPIKSETNSVAKSEAPSTNPTGAPGSSSNAVPGKYLVSSENVKVEKSGVASTVKRERFIISIFILL